MHFLFYIFEVIVKNLFLLIMYARKEKTNYLLAPDSIISYINRERIFKMGHLFPSVILSIIVGVKILPEFSASYALALDKNSWIVTIAILVSLIPILLINGSLIETVLNKTNSNYYKYKNDIENTDFDVEA